MPRARCHWSLLLRTREALRAGLPDAYDTILAHRGEYLAGGMAPDALRLFAGQDKLSSHFYDDQRQETWDRVVDALREAQPAVADAARLSPAGRAWIFGYLTHVLTDVAYWRHVLARLPPFPDYAGIHHGAWMLADQAPVAPNERTLDVNDICFGEAPLWIHVDAVQRMLARVTERILVPDGVWAVELAYLRSRQDSHGRSDEDLLSAVLGEWEANLAAARALLPPAVWASFEADAVRNALRAIALFLDRAAPAPAGSSPDRDR